MSKPEEKSKLIIDEDWKTQVEKEREQLRKKDAEHPTHTDETATWSPEALTAELEGRETDKASAGTDINANLDTGLSDSTDSNELHSDSSDHLPPPPPASFPFLVSMLGTQALAAMGQLGEGPDAPPVRLDYAKHYIDLLALLEVKTKGQLDTTEYDLLADWLHQLRMTYVNMAKKA